ncbi:MAG: hypothetical protein ABW049_09295 [Spongiibacteraceae bacterium]
MSPLNSTVLTLIFLALWLAGTTSAQPLAQPAVAQPPARKQTAVPIDPVQLETTRQLLDWLGVDAIVEQTPLIADQALLSEAKFRAATSAQQAEWRRQLTPQFNTTTLRERIARSVAQQVDPQTLQQALALLQMPLPRRARYFELAMAQSGAGAGLKEFRAQFDATPNPARRQLARGLVDASAGAELLAQWQTSISVAVAHSAEPAAARDTWAKTQEDAVKERTRHLATLAEAHALYTYRYLTDAELETYRDTLNHAAIQRILEVCRHNLAQALTE